MEECDERQRDFDKKRKDMKEQVVKFEKFVRENDQKHKRAELKAKSERKLREQLEEKKKKCQDELQMCMKESERFEGSLRSLVRYKSYLDSVTESSSSDGEYEEIMDILQRYWTLRNANNDLQQQQNERTAELDAARKNNAETLQRLQQELLVRNSNIHGMQRKIESLRHESQKQGGEIELKEHVRKTVKKDCGQIVMSIKNLYNRCGSSGKTSKPPKIAFSEKAQQLAYMEACLSYIQDRVLDLSGVAAGYANQNQLNSASTASVPSSPTANATKF